MSVCFVYSLSFTHTFKCVRVYLDFSVRLLYDANRNQLQAEQPPILIQHSRRRFTINIPECHRHHQKTTALESPHLPLCTNVTLSEVNVFIHFDKLKHHESRRASAKGMCSSNLLYSTIQQQQL